MAKITIIDGNDEIELSTAPKENIKAYMVKGEPGTDGVSPTITASRTGKVTTLTMTDKNGTTSADINDGVDPTVTTSKVDRTTTMTITDINGTRTTEIYDGIDLTGGVPTNGVIGFDTDELIYTCDGTETGSCYLTYDGVDFSFTMPTVEEGDVLVFNTSTLILTLDNTTITTEPLPGTGTELTFTPNIPGGYEITDEPFPGAGSITVHDSYSTSTTSPYSANYVNNAILTMMYPIGSIYMSVNSTNPSVLFGGTWEQLEDRFLLGASSTYSAGSTGGGTTTGQASGDTGSITLTINQMPAHTHRPSLYDAGLKTLVGGLNWTSATSKLSGYWGTSTTETGGYIERVGGGKGHTHTLNNHTHTQALPPYLAVYIWKRTA